LPEYPQQSAVVVPYAVHDNGTEDSDDEHEDADDSDVQNQEDDLDYEHGGDGQDDGNDDGDGYEPDETEQGMQFSSSSSWTMTNIPQVPPI
jgi:hypothetical protein